MVDGRAFRQCADRRLMTNTYQRMRDAGVVYDLAGLRTATALEAVPAPLIVGSHGIQIPQIAEGLIIGVGSGLTLGALSWTRYRWRRRQQVRKLRRTTLWWLASAKEEYASGEFHATEFSRVCERALQFNATYLNPRERGDLDLGISYLRAG